VHKNRNNNTESQNH